jgi:hypothetical protein
LNDRSRLRDHYVTDDRTGFKVWASGTVTEWTGLVVSRENAEPRHPQDFVKGRADRRRGGKPAATPVFISAFDYGFDEGFDSP